ncbi:MAG: hypothetical protein OES23_00440 [Nitrosopumilus sp.]|jgi:hypothetical protein|nr:hypothetical protein [Nitrosopumilus sp.]
MMHDDMVKDQDCPTNIAKFFEIQIYRKIMMQLELKKYRVATVNRSSIETLN